MSSETIEDDERLYRRIYPGHVKPDGTLSSAAFTDPEMSVDRATLTAQEQTLREHPTYGLADFSAGFARGLEQEVVADPELLNKAHALVKGKKTGRVKKLFAKESRLLKQPQSDC